MKTFSQLSWKTGISISAFLISACSAPEIDKAFVPYVQEFAQEAAKRHKEFHVNFDIKLSDRVPEEKDGYCDSEIRIRRDLWETASEDIRRVLFFHELGHCALGRFHTDDFDGNIPKSIMNTHYTPVVKNWKLYRKEFLDELFAEAP